MNSSEWARKEINDEVDQFIDCEFSVLIANLVLFLDFAAKYTRKRAEQKGNKNNNNSEKFAGKTAVSNGNDGNNGNNGNNTEVADAKGNVDNRLDAEVAGYQDAINWLNSFIKTKAGLAKLRAKVWETLTQGHAVEFLD